MSNERIKRWTSLSVALGITTFLISLICFIALFDSFSRNFTNDGISEISIDDASISAVRPMKSPIQIAIYKNDKMIWSAPCLVLIDICNEEDFFIKRHVKKIIGVKLGKSRLFIKEVHFENGLIHKEADDEGAEMFVRDDSLHALKAVSVFFFSSVLFFSIAIFLRKINR